jgi:hypothetical protein
MKSMGLGEVFEKEKDERGMEGSGWRQQQQQKKDKERVVL